MSQTAELFASIDAQTNAAKAAWNVEKQDLLDRIVRLELEISASKDREREAIEGRIRAERGTSALNSLFAVVRHVLDEAAQHEIDKLEGKTLVPANNLNLEPGGVTNVQT